MLTQRQPEQQQSARRRRQRFLQCETLETRSLLAGNVALPSTSDAWQTLEAIPPSPTGAVSYLPLNAYSALSLDADQLRAQLAAAPMEFTAAADQPLEFRLPTPDGQFARFALVESPIMAPELGAQFPEIRTYAGQGIDDPSATVRLDLTLQGFHAQVLSSTGSYYVDPYYHLDTSAYVSYFKTDIDAAARTELMGGPLREEELTTPTPTKPFALPPLGPARLEDVPTAAEQVFYTEAESQAALLASAALGQRMGPAALARGPASSAGEDPVSKGPTGGPRARSGTFLRTYRAAVAVTGEYTIFHGGTVPLGLSAVVTAMNRLTGIYENELSIRFELIPNNFILIYDNPVLDPYTNTSGGALLTENQASLDARIGNANYDIGHVFGTGGGGLAGLGVVGITGSKAQGETGSSSPIGDPFYVDYVAHEMGHQFGANHIWGGDTPSCDISNFNAPTAMEPGSGTTILSYAGICGNDDIQPNSDANFHSISFDEIITHVDTVIPLVGTRTLTGNSIPAVNAGLDYVIPSSTPFTLTAVGTDADFGDVLTYSWEQRNASLQRDLPAVDTGVGAWFRTRVPDLNPARTFPRLSDLLVNSPAVAESLTPNGRIMDFRVTVRDNRFGGAGVNTDDMRLRLVNTGGPFRVTSPNSTVHWAAKSTQLVTWNVSGTTGNGINTSHVNILLSTDGGLTFPTALATNVANDGIQLVSIPDLPPLATARVRIEPVGNIYFDISDVNFFIDPPLQPVDYGDAPDPFYPTLIANGGPSHTIGGPRLGNYVDGELNGQSSNAANGDGLDDDGIAILSPPIAGQSATIQVVSSLAGAKLDYFFDFDNNGVFGNVPNEVFSATLVAGAQTLTINVPANAAIGSSFARFRISSAGGLGPTGPAPDGEVEDYSVAFYSALPVMDFGDAPDSYGTFAASGGPRHVLSGLQLGNSVDAEVAAFANATSTGDGTDDDGVKFGQLLLPGTNAIVSVTASNAGIVNYFFDFDGSGVFGDQPNESFQGAVAAGVNSIVVPVPTTAFIGTIAARFRLSTAGSLGPYGLALDGEVEDYQVRTIGISVCTPFENFDSAIAPALPAGWTRTSVTAGAPVNWRTTATASDTAPNHASVASVSYVSTNSLISPAFTVTSFNQRIRFQHTFDLESYFDGAVLEISINGGVYEDILAAGGTINFGGYYSLQPISTLYSSTIGGRNAWTGESGDFYETVVTLPGPSFGQSVRLRWVEATDSSLSEVGWKIDTITQCRVALAFDYGDAPGPYPTASSASGAAHAADGPLRLGANFDTEVNGAPNSNATGDDGAAGDDEDGVTFVTPVTQGGSSLISVTSTGNGLLQGWIDFNDDGDWADPGEQIFADLPIVAGSNTLPFQVSPAAVITTQTFARFRLSTQAGLSFVGQASDGEVEDYQLPIVIGNAPPTINALGNLAINEDAPTQTVNFFGVTAGSGDSQAIQVTASSDNPFLIANPTVNYISPGMSGSLAFTPTANQFGAATITVTVRDAGVDGVLINADDAFTSTSFIVTVNSINDLPSFVRGADQFVPLNAGPQTVANWATSISPGAPNEAGQTVSINVTGNTNSSIFSVQPSVASDGTLTYTPATGGSGSSTITLVAQDSAGGLSAPQTFVITINGPITFQVLGIAQTTTGVALDFNRNFDVSTLNLYDTQGGGIGAPDVVLQGAAVGTIRGSVFLDANLHRLTFVATAGRLAPDSYTLTLRSAADGFHDTNAELLDGDANGTPGGNFVQTFVVNAPASNAVTISLPNFARGPQQPVNVPANVSTGLPISFSDGVGVTTASFQLRYNTALLTITGATIAPGLPVGSSVNINTGTPGVALIQFSSPTPLPAGTTRFIDLQASVPTSATYRSKQLLDISNVLINAGAIPGLDDDALHVAAYFGDSTGNGTYSAPDASRISRLAVGFDTGLLLYKLLDPVIVADITSNNAISALDASRMLQAAVGIAVTEIPPLPSPAVSLTQGGPDPKLSIPTTLVAQSGSDVTIPVHIDSIVDLTGNGLESADLVIYYDAALLDVHNVSLGSLVAGYGDDWFVISRIDSAAGRIFVSLAGTLPLEGFFQGELVQLHATVKPTASSGTTAINLAASAHDPSRFTQLNEGYLTLIPAPTDAANDPGVDGLLTIVNATPAIDLPTAQVVDNQLLITGTSGNDRIFVSPVGDGLVRVRAGQDILGTFSRPQGIAINGLTGSDYVVVSAQLPALIATAQENANDLVSDDLIFAGLNSQWVDSLELPAPGVTGPLSSHDQALLHLLAAWTADQADEPLLTGSLVRRRR